MTRDVRAAMALLHEDPRVEFLGQSREAGSEHRARDMAGGGRVVPLPLAAKPGRASPFETSAGHLLPREYFLAQVHREKRRADRSKAPLSLVTLRAAQGDDARNIARLVDVLLLSTRETDVLGQLEPNTLAVLCTETGADGVRRLVEKIDAGSNGLLSAIESATYPDPAFERLMASQASTNDSCPVVPIKSRATSAGTYSLKRAIDIAGAVIATVVLSPLMLMTALAVRLSSPGPVIFRQTRIGKGGVPFDFFKFRSMVVGGDDGIHREFVKSLIKGEHEKVNQQDVTAPLYKLKADPRVTWVGRIIRRTSIDELPQLYNVLRGDMSLVGPRPPLPYEAENYATWHLRRVLDIKPGITGLWQVEGRSTVSFDEMVRLDLRYARGCSLWLDLRILVQTVKVVLRCSGAK